MSAELKIIYVIAVLVEKVYCKASAIQLELRISAALALSCSADDVNACDAVKTTAPCEHSVTLLTHSKALSVRQCLPNELLRYH
jgi:hypothetical protein